MLLPLSSTTMQDLKKVILVYDLIFKTLYYHAKSKIELKEY